MLINLNLIYTILSLTYQSIYADRNEHFLKYRYPFRIYKSFLNDPIQYEYNRHPTEFYPIYYDHFNPPNNEYIKANQYKQHPNNRNQNLEYNNNFNYRSDLYREPSRKKEIIEINSLSDDDTAYADLNDLKVHNSDGLIAYNEKSSYEHSNNLLDNHFFKKAKTTIASDEDFSYDDQANWSGECTSDALQSPIALSARNSNLDLRSKLDIGIRYAKDIPIAELENKGHTVQFSIPKNAGDLIITGPALDYEVYKATALHFHWGENDTVGSEHTINNVRFPLEMHIVHFNTKYFNLEEALKHPDGTVVIAVMFKIGKENVFIDPLTRKLKKIRCKGQKTNIRDINLLRLFPAKVRRLYQYYGSLTTPPCTPTVKWIVVENPNLISSEQIEKFRLLTEDELCQNLNERNWRDLQDLENRDIKRSILI